MKGQKPLRIVMFGHKRIPSREGGVEIVVEELSTLMAQQGHSVTCYNRAGHHVCGAEFDTQKTDTYKGVRLKSVWTLNKKGLAAVTSSFFAAVRAAFSKADVVHIHAEGPAFMCWLLKLFRKKVIVTVHGLDWQQEKWNNSFGSKYIQAGEKMAVRFADSIVVLSRNIQEYFKETYGRDTVWIPNGVHKPQIVAADRITQQFGLEKDGYFLFLGRLIPGKGVRYLIEAYQNLHTDKKLVIAGGGSDTDDHVRELQELAAGNENIIFTGFVQGQLLDELYSNCYVYVLPSDHEGMPLSLLEAMSYGNCSVISDIPECTEVAEDNAVVFPRGDVAALLQRLQELCDNPARVAQFRAVSSDFITNKYSWDDVVRQTLELYREGLK